MWSRTGFSLLIVLHLSLGPVESGRAQDDFFEPLQINIQEPEASTGDSFLGWISQQIAYGYEAPGPVFSRADSDLTKLETSLYLQYDRDLGANTAARISGSIHHDEVFRVNGDIDYSHDEIDEFRNRYQLRDLYIEHETEGGVYLKLGNQILAWGMAEYLRVTDLVNIRDLYTLAQQDLEDIRLQIPALLLSTNVSNWSLEAAVSLAAGHDLIAPRGDEFDPFIAAGNLANKPVFLKPDQKHEVFFRASTRWQRGDLQFVAGEFNENSFSSLGEAGTTESGRQPRFGQRRSRAMGLAGNWVEGPWLFFAEAALHKNRSLRLVQDWTTPAPNSDQWLSALGFEYNGFSNLLLGVEIDGIRIRNQDNTPTLSSTRHSAGLRAYWTGFNQRLELLAVWNELINAGGQVTRISVDYDWSDNFSAGLLWVAYDGDSDTLLYPYRNNDIIQFQLRYNFQL